MADTDDTPDTDTPPEPPVVYAHAQPATAGATAPYGDED